jgi:hypothetical protein
MKRPILILMVAGLLTGCGGSNSDKTPPSNASTNAASNPPSGYLGTLMNAKNSSEKKIDVTFLNEAIQQFNVQEGHYPKSLQELVPNYVAKLPETPVGTKLDYDPAAGVVKVVQQ